MYAYGCPLRVRNSRIRSVPGGMVRPDEHDVAEAVRDELHPPEDERPHEDLAQLGVGLHEREQVIAIELDHLARHAGARTHQRPAAREHVGLAGELARPMDGDDGLAGVRRPDDLDLTRGDDEERHVLVPDIEEHLSGGHGAFPAVRGDARDWAAVSVGNT